MCNYRVDCMTNEMCRHRVDYISNIICKQGVFTFPFSYRKSVEYSKAKQEFQFNICFIFISSRVFNVIGDINELKNTKTCIRLQVIKTEYFDKIIR